VVKEARSPDGTSASFSQKRAMGISIALFLLTDRSATDNTTTLKPDNTQKGRRWVSPSPAHNPQRTWIVD